MMDLFELSNQLIRGALCFYFLSALFYVIAWIFNSNLFGKFATGATYLGLIFNLTSIILRWIVSYQKGFGHAPLSSLYESLIFFSLTLAILYLIIEYRYKNRTIGVFVSPILFLTMAYAASSFVNPSIKPLMPALKSNWLIAHVATCFLGYTGFAIAFGISIMFLIKRKDLAERHILVQHIPKVHVLDELTHQLIMFGFFFLSIGIITGAVWANSAWGRYWGWDPKETWSLITWCIYAALLHARITKGWQGTRIALISIFGFLAVLFTYFGVSYLPGLHSYGL